MHEKLNPQGRKQVSLQEIKNFLANSLETEKELSKRPDLRDLEGFLSTFVYSVDGYANAKYVIKNIFMDDINALNILQTKVRRNPPAGIQHNGAEVNSQSHRYIKDLLLQLEEKVFVGAAK